MKRVATHIGVDSHVQPVHGSGPDQSLKSGRVHSLMDLTNFVVDALVKMLLIRLVPPVRALLREHSVAFVVLKLG